MQSDFEVSRKPSRQKLDKASKGWLTSSISFKEVYDSLIIAMAINDSYACW